MERTLLFYRSQMNPLAWQYRELVQGLHSLRPKKRGNPVSWIILMGCTYVVGGLGADASVREALFAPSAPHHAPAFTAAAPALPAGVAPANMRVAMPVVVIPTPQALAAPVQPESQPGVTEQQDDSPLPHAKAHNTAPTKRAHSGKRHK